MATIFKSASTARAVAVGVTAIAVCAVTAVVLWRQTQPVDPRILFGDLPRHDILQALRADIGALPDDYTDAQRPTLHRQYPPVTHLQTPHIVVLLELGFGVEPAGLSQTASPTPYFDQWRQEGVYFSRVFATDHGTANAITAITTGLPAAPNPEKDADPTAFRDIFRLHHVLKRAGYTTLFIYKRRNFDNQATHFTNAGFDRIIEATDDPNAKANSNSDAVLFEHLDAHLNSRPDGKPLYIVALTDPNQTLQEFTQNGTRLDVTEQAAARSHAQSADLALGNFLNQAKTQNYFKQTLFLIAPLLAVYRDVDAKDTWNRAQRGALLLGPHVSPRRVDTLAGLPDLPVTLLGATGFETTHPMVGRDLLGARRPGRALIKDNDRYVYATDNEIAVLDPHAGIKLYRQSAQEPTAVQQSPTHLETEARAHIFASSLLLKENAYSLPRPSGDSCDRP